MRLSGLVAPGALIAIGFVCTIAPGGETSITEGPDTVGSSLVAQSPVCHPDQDGNADLSVTYWKGWPFLVCSRSSGTDRDILFHEWSGPGRQGESRFLTSSPVDEIDPRVHVDGAGDVYVVWWEDAVPPSVMMVRRPAGSETWERPLPVAQSGRRPSIASWDGVVGVAFERDGPSGGLEVVVATGDSLGFAFRVVAETARTGTLDVRLHAEQGRVWVEWNRADGRRVASELRGGEWASPRPASWLSAAPADY